MLPLEGEDVLTREPVDRIGRGFRAHVDDDGGRDELLERDAVRRQAAGREVDRCVEVRPAVLGRRERVRRIEVAPRRLAERELLQPKPAG
jgi:hypothetical protein